MYHDSQGREIEDQEMDNMRRDARAETMKNQTIAMVLEDHGQVKYLRVLEQGAIEPVDHTVGDVHKHLDFWYGGEAALVDSSAFMQEWNQRRAGVKAS